MKIRFAARVMVLFLLIPLAACNGINPTLSFTSNAQTSLLTMTVSQADLQAGLNNALLAAAPSPMIDPVIILRRGQLLLSAQFKSSTNGSLTPFSIHLLLGGSNGQLSATVISVQLGGLTLSGSQLDWLNKPISQWLAQFSQQNTASARLDSIAIGDGSLSIGLRIPTQNLNGLNPLIQVQTTAHASLVTVALSARDIAALLRNIPNAAGQPLLPNPLVGLSNGAITITGTVDQGGGALPTLGSVTFTPSIQNGQLTITISALHYGNYTAQDADLVSINQDIAQRLAQAMPPTVSKTRLTQIAVTDTALTFTIEVPR